MKRILTIGGSDSGGCAGIQADLKTVTMLGGYGMSVVTALTAQNTMGVQAVHPVPPDFVGRQLESVLSDIGVDAVKTGMLVSREIVLAATEQLRQHKVTALVVDPVMTAETGHTLLDDPGRVALREELLPLALVVAPNLPEASELCGFQVSDLGGMKEAARAIRKLGPRFVLVKGGHLKGNAVGVLYDGGAFQTFDAVRVNSLTTERTGRGEGTGRLHPGVGRHACA